MNGVGEIPELSGAKWVGHIAEMRTDPMGLMRRLNRERGDIARLRIITLRLVVANSPDLVEQVLVTKARAFRKSRLVRTALYPLAGEGLFTSEGDLWRRQRKLMAPHFQPAKLAPYGASMSEAAVRCVDTWRDGAVLDVAHETTRIAMAVAGKALFDSDTFDETDEIGEALTAGLRWAAQSAESVALVTQVQVAGALERASTTLPGVWGKRAARAAEALQSPIMFPGERTRSVRKAIGVLDERMLRMIAERRAAAAPRADLLTRLLNAHDGDDGLAMSDRQLRDEMVTLFVAGHETTATALAWAFYLLGRNPETLARLEAEVAALGGRTPGVEDLPRLQYALRVFKEALRCYPPVPFMEREAAEEVEIGGYRLPRGAYVVVLPWAVHHRAEWWDEPERFDPDRYAPEAEAARPRMAWIPFGAGPRICIGNHFALMEGPLVLATILQRARLEPVSDAEIKVDPRAATARPAGGVPMRVRLRETRPAARA
jgi:cytochrome P450